MTSLQASPPNLDLEDERPYKIDNSHSDTIMSADFWAGYVSGAAGIIVGNPLDLVKVRLQAGLPILPAPNTIRGRLRDIGTLVRGVSTSGPAS